MSCFLLFIVTWVYAPWFFVSSQQRFGLTDIKAPSACHSPQVLDRPCYSSQVSKGPCYSSEKSVLQFNVTALFYSEDSRKIHLWGVRAHRSKDARRRALQCAGERERKRERASELWLLFLYVFFVLFCFCPARSFYLRSSLRSSDLPLFCFPGLIPSLSFSTAILDSFSLFYLPNIIIEFDIIMCCCCCCC